MSQNSEGELIGCLVIIIFSLIFKFIWAALKLIFWFLSLPLSLMIKGLSALGPIKAFIALLIVGGILAGVVLSNPEWSRQLDEKLDEFGIDINLPEIDAGGWFESAKNTLADVFPDSTSTVNYRIRYPDVRGRSCPQTSCSVEVVYVTDTTIEVLGFEEGATVNGESTWLRVAYEDGEVYVHSPLAEPIEIIVEIPTPIPDPIEFVYESDTYYDGAYTISRPMSPVQVDVLYINGIRTNPEGHFEILPRLEATFPNKVIGGIYNLHDGNISDSDQARDDLSQGINGTRPLGTVNPAVDALVTYLTINNHNLIIVAHSQGAAIVSAALGILEREHPEISLSNLTIYTFGGFSMVFPDGPKYSHCDYHTDAIPIIARILTNDILLFRVNEQNRPLFRERQQRYWLYWREIDALDEILEGELDLDILKPEHDFDEYLHEFNTTNTCLRY